MAIWQIVIALAWGLVVAISPWQSSRYLIARNEQVVIRSACIAAVTIVSIQVGLYATAATVNLTRPDIEPMESTMIWAATNILPSWLGALMLAGLMAAALSSATTFLSLVGFSLSHDILPRRGRLTSDYQMLKFSRLMMLLVGYLRARHCLDYAAQHMADHECGRPQLRLFLGSHRIHERVERSHHLPGSVLGDDRRLRLQRRAAAHGDRRLDFTPGLSAPNRHRQRLRPRRHSLFSRGADKSPRRNARIGWVCTRFQTRK